MLLVGTGENSDQSLNSESYEESPNDSNRTCPRPGYVAEIFRSQEVIATANVDKTIEITRESCLPKYNRGAYHSLN